jgi:hypothetical protein
MISTLIRQLSKGDLMSNQLSSQFSVPVISSISLFCPIFRYVAFQRRCSPVKYHYRTDAKIQELGKTPKDSLQQQGTIITGTLWRHHPQKLVNPNRGINGNGLST